MEITPHQLDHINKMIEELHMGLNTIKLYIGAIAGQDNIKAILDKLEKPRGDE